MNNEIIAKLLKLIENTQPQGKKMADKNILSQFSDLSVQHDGTKIILPGEPKKMALLEGAEFLTAKHKELQEEFSINSKFECFPLDGAVALQRALIEVHGHTIGQATFTMFGKKPPTMISVPVGYNQTVQVPWGRVRVSSVDGYFETYIPSEHPSFGVGGTVKKINEPEVQQILDMTREKLKTHSIYQGQAIRVSFAYLREDRPFDPVDDSPIFMDLSKVREEQLIFPEETAKLIKQGLFLPIQKSDQCRKNGIPLKRGVLLEGPYGCGKTLTANVLAKIATDNGWTFMYIDDPRDLPLALKFARLYGPCVIFCEDIDQAIQGDRSIDMNTILNTLDGVDYKNEEIITVLTTNHIENINPAFLRPGRLDTVVPVRPPDQGAAVRLLEYYGGNLLNEDCDLEVAALKLQGQIPATLRECVERAKLNALSRSDVIVNAVMHDDLIDALDGMKPHMQLMLDSQKKPVTNTAMDACRVLGESIGTTIAKASGIRSETHTNRVNQGTSKLVEEIEV